ncbi:MAG: GNAT family N-acetyltransferase [Candidatus Limnocylindrales bacterium]
MEVRPLTVADIGPWARLLAVCFERSPAQMEGLLAWFHAGFELVTMGAWDGDRLVAQYNARLLGLWVPGFESVQPAGMGLNMAVDPEYRGQGLLDQVAAPVHDALAARGCVAGVGFSSASGLGVTKASRHYAYEVLGPMVSLAVPLTRRRYPERLETRSTWPDGAINLEPRSDGFVRFDASAASLRHRYADHPFRRYAYATRERDGIVDGLVVYRETRLRGLPAVSLLAVHGRDPVGLLGSFAATLRARRRLLVHVLLAPQSPLRGALAAMGPQLPVPLSRNPYHLIARALSPDTSPVLFDLARWDCAGGDIL